MTGPLSCGLSLWSGIVGGGSAPAVPSNTVAPVASGTATVGSLLSVTNGTWVPAASSGYTYQWKRNGTNIGGATSSTYTLVSADAGKSITAAVIGSNGAGAGSPATSNAIVVANELPQQGSLVARWSADDMTPQADNTLITGGWTDSVGGVLAAQGTAANQPYYRTNRLNGKPSIEFKAQANPAYFDMGRPTAVVNALNSNTKTLMFVVRNVAAGKSGRDPIWANGTGNLNNWMTLDGTYAGQYNGAMSWATPAFGVVAFRQNTNFLAQCCHLAFNGGCVSYAAPWTAGASGSIYIGAGDAGGGTSNFGFRGEILDVLLWNTELTQTELFQAEMWACDKYAQAYPWAGQPALYAAHGDSIQSGQALSGVGHFLRDYTSVRLAAAAKGLSYGQWFNPSIPGATFNDLNTRAPGDIDGVVTQTGMTVKLHVWEWTNMRSAPPVTLQVGYATTYLAGRKAANGSSIKIALGDSVGVQDDTTNGVTLSGNGNGRVAYNAAIAAIGSNVDYFSVLSTDPSVGAINSNPFGASYPTQYFADTLHPAAKVPASNPTGHTVLSTYILAAWNAL